MARAKKAAKASKKPTSKRAKKAASAGRASTSAAKKKSAARKTAKKAPAKKAGKKAAPKKSTATKASTKKPAKKATATKATAKKPAKKPRRAKSPFDSRFLEKMRKSLVAERDTYDRQATMLQAEADSLVADIDPGDVQFDEESGEGDTIAVERGRDLALASKAREMIGEIDHALAKFDLGTYGICEVSEEPIPKERLDAIPWAREKVEFKVGGFGRR